LHVAVIVTGVPQPHLQSVAIDHVFPVITALACAGAVPTQPTVTVMELLVHPDTVPLTETWLAPGPSDCTTIDDGLIVMVHTVKLLSDAALSLKVVTATAETFQAFSARAEIIEEGNFSL